MAIELHCPHCGKHVKAPDDAGGKRGRCPSCEQSMYIPSPADAQEPLDIAPLDEQDEAERQRLLDEAKRLRDETMHATDLPAGASARAAPAAGLPPGVDMRTLVINYTRALANGELSEAEELLEDIRKDKAKAEDIIGQISQDEVPPAPLADVPRPVLIGFLKQLRGAL